MGLETKLTTKNVEKYRENLTKRFEEAGFQRVMPEETPAAEVEGNSVALDAPTKAPVKNFEPSTESANIEPTTREIIKSHKDRVVFSKPTESYKLASPPEWKINEKEPRNFEREIRIREEGSPVRSLASALADKPTDEEWTSLFGQIDADREYAKAINANVKGTNHSELNAHIIERNERHMENLIIDYASNDSAFGDKLRRSQVYFRDNQTPDQLRKIIKEGQKIIVSTEVPGKGRQMIHLGIAKSGRFKDEFIALSEKGKPVIKPDKTGRYTTIAITPPKEDPKTVKRAERKQHLLNVLKKISAKETKNYKDYTKIF